ncbi:hypothetical protein Hanom_Chr00s101842g01804211 [Helianthus anomalus]
MQEPLSWVFAILHDMGQQSTFEEIKIVNSETQSQKTGLFIYVVLNKSLHSFV